MRATLTTEAERELVESALYYAQEANTEVGRAFIAEFDRVIELLQSQPKLGAIWRGTTRRIPLRRFPFNVVYESRESEIRILALAHQRRKPGFWRDRA